MPSASSRSIVPLLLSGILMLSGWAVAVGLGLRLREHDHDHHRHHDHGTTTTPDPAEPKETQPEENKFERAFAEFRSHPEMAGAAVAFCLLDEQGVPIFESPLAKTALIPASSLKTVTSAAAFAILGPDFRFETTLATTTPIKSDGSLVGDLILVGGGDPTLSSDDLGELAKAAVAAGLKSVSGNLQVDTSVFPPNPVSDHWVWGDLGNGYGAGAFGLNLDHNRLELSFEPSPAVGGPAKLLAHTAVAQGTEWINLLTTGPAGSGDGVVIYSAPYGRTITLRGTVPLGEAGFSVSAAIPDPPALAAEVLRAHLEAAGVKFNAPAASSAVSAPAAAARTVLATHTSAPLPEIVDHLHRVSDNLETQCLFLTIGLKLQRDPSDGIRDHWKKAGVDFVGLRHIDGSGLARANVIRPLDLAMVNYKARHAAHGQRYFESLSTYLNGQVRGKIGGMSGVKTQVGFVQTAQNREFTYAIMGNSLSPGREFWRRLETLLEAVRTTEL